MIPAELVHKHAAGEVLLTAVTADAGIWLAGARLPDRHRFHGDATGRQSGYHDPLLILEAFRQGCIAVGHLGYAVPPDFHYAVRHYEFAVLAPAALESSSANQDFDIRMTIRREFRPAPDAAVNGLIIAASARRDGIVAMELSAGFSWMPEARWQQLRAGSTWEPGPQSPPAAPAVVGRRRAANVVIGSPARRRDGSVCAPVLVDLGNRTFFDHPLDHLPGGLLIEACRQLALAELGTQAATVLGPSRLRCEFHSFAELRPGCVVVLEPERQPLAFRGEVHQSGRVRAGVALGFETAPEFQTARELR